MTRQQAISAKCTDCIYDSANKGTRLAQIEECTVESCSLYEYRPVTRKTVAERMQKKKESMTEDQLKAYNKKAENARRRLQK